MTTAPRSEATISKTENVRATTLARAAARDAGEELLLTPAEIATKLRVCRMTVYRLIESGEIRGGIRVGRSIRVPYSAFQAYLAECEIGR